MRAGELIVAVSASVLSHPRQRYADSGFDAILDKPIDVEQVAACLSRLLNVHFTEDEETDTTDLPPLTLDPQLDRRLREASEYYQITELIELIDELTEPGEVGAAWAQRLHDCVSAYDMQGLRDLLDHMGPDTESPVA